MRELSLLLQQLCVRDTLNEHGEFLCFSKRVHVVFPPPACRKLGNFTRARLEHRLSVILSTDSLRVISNKGHSKATRRISKII